MVAKLLLIPFFLLFLISNPLINQDINVFALSCAFELNPKTPDQNMGKLEISIKSTGVPPGKYEFYAYRPDGSHFNSTGGFTADQTPAEVNLSLNGSEVFGKVVYDPPFKTGWASGTYKLELKSGNTSICSASFPIQEAIAQSSCSIKITNTSVDPNTDVNLLIENINQSDGVGGGVLGIAGYDLNVDGQQKEVIYVDSSRRLSKNIGKYVEGTHIVKIFNRCGLGGANCIAGVQQQLQCSPLSFIVAPLGSGGGGQITPPPTPATTPPTAVVAITNRVGQSCTYRKSDEITPFSEGEGVATAIGCIPTNPVDFVAAMLKFVFGIIGGIALLLMVIAIFQLMTSAGNPDSLKQGSERLTSAMIGLLVVIFAVLLLKIIGVDILDLEAALGF